MQRTALRAATDAYRWAATTKSSIEYTSKDGTFSHAHSLCGSIDELETPHLFDVQEVRQAGGFGALLGLPLSPEQLIQETKARLLAA